MTATDSRTDFDAAPAVETSFLPSSLPSEPAPTGSFLDTSPPPLAGAQDVVPSAAVGRGGRMPTVRGDRQPFIVRLGRALCGHHMD